MHFKVAKKQLLDGLNIISRIYLESRMISPVSATSR